MLSPNADCAKGRRLAKQLLEDDVRPVFEFVQQALFGVDDDYLPSVLPHGKVVVTVACVSETVLAISGDQSFGLALVT
jgi:hypothetical protein